MNKYIYNKNYFKNIDSAEKAYWLGFLYADGCITRFYRGEKLKSMSLEVTLNSDDTYHIKNFRKSLESNLPLQERTIAKKYKASRMVVNCTAMCRDLISLGCTPQKSLTAEFPSSDILREEFVSCFIKGYFDGNGGFFYRKYENQTVYKCYFSSGSKTFLEHLSIILKNNGINTHKIVQRNAHGFDLHIGGLKNVKKFIEKIYEIETPELQRKRHQANLIINDFKNIA